MIAECIGGHAMTPANTYVQPKTGKRFCRTCHRDRQIRYRRVKGQESRYASTRDRDVSYQDRNHLFVYLISDGQGHVKIGTARDPERRLAALQIGHPVSLTIEATQLGGYQAEAELHRRFADQRIRGEWFQFSPEIRDHVAELTRSAIHV